MATTTTVKRASTFAPGIGEKLDELLGTDVIVKSCWIGERTFNGEMRPIVLITLDNDKVYHAWSESLAAKMSEIPVEEFPLIFKFVKVPTRSYPAGVLTFE